jgi:hypothetical protein
MPGNLGPPEKEERPPKGPINSLSRHHTTTDQGNSSAGGRQTARYAHAWRYGFGCGFRSALNLAARRLPPETWPVLETIVDDYDLAGAE